jgi:predicted RNA-binding Zn ribbon-like protein
MKRQWVESDAELREFPFRSGRRCLDFVATLGSRGDLNIERLQAPADLRRWTESAGFGDVGTTSRRQLQRALELREAIYAVLTCPEDSLPTTPLHVLNRAAAVSSIALRLEPDRTTRFVRPAVPAVMSLLARETIELASGSLSDRIRRCAGAHCTILFIDESRPGTRRWCSMDRCGNRLKAEGLRKKRAAARRT